MLRSRLAYRQRLALVATVALVIGAVLLAPSTALACPQCALGRDEGPARDLLVAGMMAAPFVIAVAVGRAIARIMRAGSPGADTGGHDEDRGGR